MSRKVMISLLGVVLLASASISRMPAQAPEKIDAAMNAKFKAQGIDSSKIMWIMHYISDRYGPRPIGSPNHLAAANWAMKQMTAWGMKNVHLEPFTWRGVGWMPGRAVGYVDAPYTSNVKFEAKPWSPSTKGTVKGDVVAIVVPTDPTQEEMTKYLASIAPNVKGGIVMVGPPPLVPVDFCPPPAKRQSDSSWRARFAPRDPNDTTAARGRGGRGGGTPLTLPDGTVCGGRGGGGGGRGGRGGAATPLPAGHISTAQASAQVAAFLRDNMPGMLLTAQGGGRIPGEIVAQNGGGQIYNDTTPQPPAVILRNDDYGRIFRTIEDGTPVLAEFNVQNAYFHSDTSYVTIGEIPGSDKADEVVMMGGHLDSWTSATGATDNGIGSANALEAARILMASGAKPRRTIRVALWSGEEEGDLGSGAYVVNHFGNDANPKPEWFKLDAYFNIDNGTGQLHGSSMFGPPEAGKIVAQYYKPWEEWGIYGASASAQRGGGSTDTDGFTEAGLAGIGASQGPIEYNSTTWHSNLDTYERIVPVDVMRNAVVTASLMYGLAMRDQMLPRFGKDDAALAAGGGGRGGANRGNGAAPDPNAPTPPLTAMPRVFATAKAKALVVNHAPGLAVAVAAGGGGRGGAAGGRGGRGNANGETTALATKPKHGTVALKEDGTFVYTPAAAFVGTDSFTFKLTRGTETSPESTVTIVVK